MCCHHKRGYLFIRRFILLYLAGQSLILFHHFLVLLVHTEHLTDPVGSRLCLRAQGTINCNYISIVTQRATLPLILSNDVITLSQQYFCWSNAKLESN